MGPEYIVIKFWERFVLTVPGAPDAFAAWAKVTVTRGERRGAGPSVSLRRIDRRIAMALIREAGLVEVLHTEDGIVYDTPDRSFQARWGGEVFVRSDIAE